MKQMNTFSKFPLFDSHHRMERFGVMFLAFIILLGSLFCICLKIQSNNKKINLGVQAKYTERTQWSLSGQYTTVENIFRNDNFTKAFVLLKVGTDDNSMTSLSTDANDYQMFMTGYNGDTITKTPKGAIYIFGNTGYIGLYFADSSGFDAHLYDVVLRCNASLTDEVNETAKEAYADADSSYQYHNQIHFYANFAGSDGIVAKFLNKDNATTDEIYAEAIGASDESGIREQLHDTLLAMNDSMNDINSYAKQLSSLGIIVPSLPEALDGDKISESVDDTANNPTQFDKSMISTASSIIDSTYYSSDITTGEGVTGININRTADSDDTTVDNTDLYLVTDYVFPGGYQFNYQTISITDTNLEGLKPSDLTFAQWVEQKKVEKQTYYTIKESLDTTTYYSTWYTSDGEEFTYTGDSSSLDIDKATNTAISNYVNSVSALYTEKYKYQTEYLYNFLRLEANSKSSSALFSINASDSALTLY